MSAVELIDQNKDILDELATRGLVARTPFGLVLTERGREALEAA
jgi:ribosomal protein S19E (S16A)